MTPDREHLELYVPEDEPPRSGAVLVYLFAALIVVALVVAVVWRR